MTQECYDGGHSYPVWAMTDQKVCRKCGHEKTTVDDIRVGERYLPKELPDNAMNESGKLEWVGDDLLALSSGGKLYEFRMAVECTAVFNVTDDGDMELLAGERR